MKHDLNRIWIYKFSGFIALLENCITKDTKKKSIDVYLQLVCRYGFKFSFTQQVSKNSLLHALIKHLKYLHIQNRCFITENISPEKSL